MSRSPPCPESTHRGVGVGPGAEPMVAMRRSITAAPGISADSTGVVATPVTWTTLGLPSNTKEKRGGSIWETLSAQSARILTLECRKVAIRSGVNRLIRNLASEDEGVAKPATIVAKYLIEKSATTHARPQDAAKFYAEMLGDEYSQLTLTEDEIEALVGALVDLLGRSATTAAAAAFSLSSSRRLRALPKLAQAIRRWAPTDGWAARQAIIAIQDIVSTTAPGQHLSPQDEQMIDEARQALDFAARAAVKGTSEARDAADQARKVLGDHLRRPV